MKQAEFIAATVAHSGAVKRHDEAARQAIMALRKGDGLLASAVLLLDAASNGSMSSEQKIEAGVVAERLRARCSNGVSERQPGVARR